MSEQCTPSMEGLTDAWVASRANQHGYFDVAPLLGVWRDEARRAIAAHDAKLREQIAREIEETLPLDLTSFHAEGQYVGISSAARIARGKES